MKKRFFSIVLDGAAYDIASTSRVRGDELIVLLHGLGCSRESFHDIWFRNEFEDYSVLAVDLLGFGESSKPVEFSYRLEDHAFVCGEVLKEFPMKRLHIVGHSMGGAVGLLLAPELLSRTLTFANLEGNLVGEDCGMMSRKAIRVPLGKFERHVLPDFKIQYENSGEEGLFLNAASPWGFYGSAESLVRWSDSGALLKIFRGLTSKKGYFYGERSPSSPALRELDEVEKIEISESGHFMMNDNPDEFYLQLKAFLLR
jgi:pimeloyl-ACP methyl ester carboxylesterase